MLKFNIKMDKRNLTLCVVTYCKIRCSACQKVEKLRFENTTKGVDYFENKGWIGGENFCYCPKCAKMF